MRSPFYLAKQISCSRATFAAPVQLSYKINLIVTSRPIIHTNHKFVTEERWNCQEKTYQLRAYCVKSTSESLLFPGEFWLYNEIARN